MSDLFGEELDSGSRCSGGHPLMMVAEGYAICYDGDWAVWWAWRLTPPPGTLRAEYYRQEAPFWAEYDRQVTPFRAERDRQVDAIWAEYYQQTAPFRAERDRQRDMLWAEFERQVAPIWLAAFLASHGGVE